MTPAQRWATFMVEPESTEQMASRPSQRFAAVRERVVDTLGSPAALRRAVVENSATVLVATLVATNVLRVVNNLVITRILAPEAFGIIGVVTAISFILTMLTDMGFNVFVIRSEKGAEPRFLNIIWTIRLFRSLGLAVLMFTFAGQLAQIFDKPELTTPIRAASGLFLLEGARSLFLVQAERARRISFVCIVEFCVFIFQLIFTITAAFIMESFWAIILGMYAQAGMMAFVSYRLFPGSGHRIAFDRDVSSELWRFARFVIASSIITIILGQADKIFIGRTLDLETLGLYMLAANLTMAGLTLVMAYVNKILLPLFAQTARENRASFPDVFYSSKRRMTLALAFIFGGGIGGGDLIVRILFDDRYLPAGIFFSLLCARPLALLVSHSAEQAIIILGRVRSALEANLVRLTWIAIAAPLGFHYFGVIGLVAAFALLEAPALLYWWWQQSRFGIFNVKEEASYVLAAAIGAAIGFASTAAVEALIARGALPNF